MVLEKGMERLATPISKNLPGTNGGADRYRQASDQGPTDSELTQVRTDLRQSFKEGPHGPIRWLKRLLGRNSAEV